MTELVNKLKDEIRSVDFNSFDLQSVLELVVLCGTFMICLLAVSPIV